MHRLEDEPVDDHEGLELGLRLGFRRRRPEVCHVHADQPALPTPIHGLSPFIGLDDDRPVVEQQDPVVGMSHDEAQLLRHLVPGVGRVQALRQQEHAALPSRQHAAEPDHDKHEDEDRRQLSGFDACRLHCLRYVDLRKQQPRGPLHPVIHAQYGHASVVAALDDIHGIMARHLRRQQGRSTYGNMQFRLNAVEEPHPA